MPPVTDFRVLVGECILDNATCVFGENVQFLPIAGGSFTVRAIFDNQYEQVDPDTEVVVATNQPVLGVRLSDLPALPQKGDRFVVRGKYYKIVDAQEDGQGGASLLMHKVL